MVSQVARCGLTVRTIPGVEASAWSWNVRFIDADLDGDDDMLVTNGFGFDTMDMDASLKLKAAQKVGRRIQGRCTKPKNTATLNSPNQLFRQRCRVEVW